MRESRSVTAACDYCFRNKGRVVSSSTNRKKKSLVELTQSLDDTIPDGPEFLVGIEVDNNAPTFATSADDIYFQTS